MTSFEESSFEKRLENLNTIEALCDLAKSIGHAELYAPHFESLAIFEDAVDILGSTFPDFINEFLELVSRDIKDVHIHLHSRLECTFFQGKGTGLTSSQQ